MQLSKQYLGPVLGTERGRREGSGIGTHAHTHTRAHTHTHAHAHAHAHTQGMMEDYRGIGRWCREREIGGGAGVGLGEIREVGWGR